jgi:hypothetical protein
MKELIVILALMVLLFWESFLWGGMFFAVTAFLGGVSWVVIAKAFAFFWNRRQSIKPTRTIPNEQAKRRAMWAKIVRKM